MKQKLITRMRARRDERHFQPAPETASPSVGTQLLAAATRQNNVIR